jgi:hypothetical protein
MSPKRGNLAGTVIRLLVSIVTDKICIQQTNRTFIYIDERQWL